MISLLKFDLPHLTNEQGIRAYIGDTIVFGSFVSGSRYYIDHMDEDFIYLKPNKDYTGSSSKYVIESIRKDFHLVK